MNSNTKFKFWTVKILSDINGQHVYSNSYFYFNNLNYYFKNNSNNKHISTSVLYVFVYITNHISASVMYAFVYISNLSIFKQLYSSLVLQEIINFFGVVT